jgi:cytochrome d ubiquinol oxidase subunit I
LILKHDADAPVAGLDTVPRTDWPPVAIVFWSFRVMVGLGVLILTLGVCALVTRLRGRLFESRHLHRFSLAMGPAGLVAVLAGWITTEVGRQPYTVHGLLRTADSVAPLDAPAVAGSLIAFAIVYLGVFGAGIWYLLRLMAHAPHPGEPGPEADPEKPTRAAGITPGPPTDPRRRTGQAHAKDGHA